MCIRQGVFPRELKLARVIPIYKLSSKQSISNYRPISILTFISKVFEKILYNHISQFMDRNDTICSNQFGFRKNHSTQQAIITSISPIIDYIIPIPKNKLGNLSESSNYRAIALSSLLCKILDTCIIDKQESVFKSHDLLFAYKANH